ncbi:hypothetical protein V1264_019937 [Littorina saxatilis]|uniref:Uncharacterized protein n=1 Tax=Littorina saxatilis TaxID=31220 RepID=A0AAN9B902_9CAEN
MAPIRRRNEERKLTGQFEKFLEAKGGNSCFVIHGQEVTLITPTHRIYGIKVGYIWDKRLNYGLTECMKSKV